MAVRIRVRNPLWITYGRATLLGGVAGLRTALPWGLLAVHGLAPQAALPLLQPAFSSPVVRGLLITAAAGEIAADKLPFIPPRTKLYALIPRIVSGAAIAAVLARAAGGHSRLAAPLGGLAALVAAQAGYRIRAAAQNTNVIPAPILGGLEDGVGIGLGELALLKPSSEN